MSLLSNREIGDGFKNAERRLEALLAECTEDKRFTKGLLHGKLEMLKDLQFILQSRNRDALERLVNGKV
jgi:hypothetical protein